MMAYFIETTRPLFEDVARALAAGNHDDARFAAHAIVGAARTAGAHRLAAAGTALEAVVVTGDPDVARSRLLDAETAFRDVETVIGTAL
jgi:HPt (histidine-containing phosphotransfer) domain-containing protein